MRYFLLLIMLSFYTYLSSQEVYHEYRAAINKAFKFYNKANYSEAAKAYKIAWTHDHGDEDADHRLYAAASNCMIDDEAGVRENLYAMAPVAISSDRKKVLVNYEIFSKYHLTDWWKEVQPRFDQRIHDLIAHHQNLKVFKHNRNIKYSAIRIDANGDTIANTFIHMILDGTGWGAIDASLQSQVLYQYEYATQDSIDHIGELDSIIDVRFWTRVDTTGVIENEEKIDMHPFRSNEFFKTELAPFPCVAFPISKENMEQCNGTTRILNSWGTYTRTATLNVYGYRGKEYRSYEVIGTINCHKLSGFGMNTSFGASNITYYFNEDYGFTEMYYDTYDGEKIIFRLVDVYESD